MATVDGITAAEAQRIEGVSVVSGSINASGRLMLVKANGTTIDAGIVTDIGHTTDTSTHNVGTIVGTSETQTLSGKTFLTPIIASFTNAQHDHTTAANGGLAWPFSGCLGTRTTTQTIADSNVELLSFTAAATYDTDSYRTSSSTFTIPALGYYDVLTQVAWAGHATGRRVIDIRLNDTTSNGTGGISIGKSNPSPSHATTFSMQVNAMRKFSATDTIKVFVNQFSNAPLDIVGSATDAAVYISITRRG